MRNKVQTVAFGLIGSLSLMQGCATTSENSGDRKSKRSSFDSEERSLEVGSAGGEFVFSRSGANQNPYKINRANAATYAANISRQVAGAQGSAKIARLAAVLEGKALSSAPMNELLGISRTIMAEAMRKDVKTAVPDRVKLSLAMGAYLQRNFPLAEFYLDGLDGSKNAKVLSYRDGFRGMIALASKQVPESLRFFMEAVKKHAGNTAAKLNLGFLNLKFGNFRQAQRYLSSVPSSWYTSHGLSLAEFLGGNTKSGIAKCLETKRLNPRSKMIQFNCALMQYAVSENPVTAKAELEAAIRTPGSPAMDEVMYRYLEKIERDISDKQRKASIERVKAAAKAAAAASGASRTTPEASKPNGQ